MKPRLLLAVLFGAVVIGLGLAQEPNLQQELDTAYLKAVSLRKSGRNAEALPYIEKAVVLGEKVFGVNHVNVGSISATAGQISYSAGKYEAAEKYFRRGVEIHERIPNNEVRIISMLSNLGTTQDILGKYADAEKTYKRTIAIQEPIAERDTLSFALTLNNYAALLFRVGRYAESEVYFKKCAELREAKLGKDHPYVADALQNLAGVYRRMRRDREAEALGLHTLQARRKAFGDEHVLVAKSLAELGIIAFNVGQHQKAEKYQLESLRIREKLLGKDNPENADCFQNLGLIYTGTGRPAEAETMFLRALKMNESRYGQYHPSISSTMSNLAVLYDYLGRHDEAVKLLVRSIEIQEKLSPGNPELAASIINLAAIHHHLGRFKEGVAGYQRALRILESSLGKDHIEVATPLNNLGALLRRLDRNDEALAYLERSLRIQERHLGVGHHQTSATINNIAMVQWNLGNFAEADKLVAKSIELMKAKYGAEEKYRADALHSRASLHHVMGRTSDALKFEAESLAIYQAEFRNIFGFSSEANMHNFSKQCDSRLPGVICLALQSKDEAATTFAFDWSLRLKGAVFDTVCRYRQGQNFLAKDETLQSRVSRYRTQKEFLANLALNPPTEKDAPRIRKAADIAQEEVALLEKELTQFVSQKMPDLVGGRDSLTTAMVRKRLPEDAALIEFSSVPQLNFKRQAWGPANYIAFVITPGGASPRLVDLGPTKEIDAGVEAMRKEFTDFQEKLKDCENDDEIAALEKKQEKVFAARSATLYTRLFAPLRKELGSAKRLYLAPDGGLNRLPFESLVGPDGKYLIEHYRCVYVSTGRDLLQKHAAPGKGTVVFANPDFKLDAEKRLAQVEKLLPKKEIAIALRGQSSRNLRSIGWKNLPGAAAEAKDIRKILDTETYGPVKTHVGAEAIEELLKAMPAPRVLHLATHGFFLDREPDAQEPSDDGAGAGWARGRLKRMDNPLLRSGIVLAGANTIGDKDATARVDDGWVTAEEIALLNLNGTELVVLSACQTGLGDIKSGEGVQGLRRAFLYAGAQTLVTSLFEVPDTETRELMQRFYSGLSAGNGKLNALHAAQTGLITNRRRTHGAAHPFFWASFVLVGNPD